MLSKSHIFVFMLLLPLAVFGQTKFDTLLQKLNSAKDDTSRCNIYYQLVRETSDIKQKAIYIKLLGDYAKVTRSARHIGMFYETDARLVIDTGNADLAIKYAALAIEQYEKINYKTGKAHVFNTLGISYKKKGDYENALNYYRQSLKLFEETNNRRMQAGLINNIATVYQSQGATQTATDFFYKAAAINIELGNKRWLAINYGNIGVSYYNLKNMDSAIKYMELSCGIHYEMGNASQIPLSLMNIGNAYRGKNEVDKAILYFKKSLQYADSSGYVDSKALTLMNAGEAYFEKKEYQQAINYVKLGIKIAEENGYLPEQSGGYEYLNKFYSAINDTKNAYDAVSKLLLIKDSLQKLSAIEQIAEMEAKYMNEKNKQENELLKEKNRVSELNDTRQNLIIYSLSIVFVLMLVFGFYMYRNMQQRKQANALLQSQNNEIVLQKNVIEQKNKEINDSINYARHIQNTLLPDLTKLNTLFSDSFIIHKPRNIVSGDFYWFAQRGQQLLVAAADCTGHGVPGAFMSMIGIDKLNQSILDFTLQKPSEILSFLNMSVKVSLKQDDADSVSHDGMDIGLIALNKQTMVLDFAGANRPLWIIRNNNIIELPSTKSAIAGNTSLTQEYTNHSITIEKNDLIYIFSDGYADQFGGDKGKKMMTKNFKQLLLSICGKPLTEQKMVLDNTHESWKGELEQVDDILVIGLKI